MFGANVITAATKELRKNWKLLRFGALLYITIFAFFLCHLLKCTRSLSVFECFQSFFTLDSIDGIYVKRICKNISM